MTNLQPLPVRATVIAAAAVLALGLAACSELSDDPLPPVGPAAKAHPEGWLTEDADSFHGQALRAAGWDLSACKGCHGADYAGGSTGVSCVTCHSRTPEGCTVCHGTPGAGPGPPEDTHGSSDPTARTVGAHQTHLRTTLTVALACGDCHVGPDGFADPGHIDGDGRAEVTLGERARRGGAAPAYDPDAGTCANTYCHGGGRFGAGVTTVWNQVGTGQAACGTCHGLPPAPDTGHPNVPATLTCNTCHPNVVSAEPAIVDPSLHMNGQTDF